MYPVPNTTYVSQGLAKFTSRFTTGGAPNLLALASAYLGEIQSLENAIFATIEAKWLDNAVGPDLDIIGDLVGQTRSGLDDNTYRAAIRLCIRANRSNGRSEDVVQLAIIIAQKLTADSNGVVGYLEYATAAFDVIVKNLLYPQVAAPLLSEAHAIGTRGSLVYSTWAPGNDLIMSSAHDLAHPKQGILGSFYGPPTGGLMFAAAPL